MENKKRKHLFGPVPSRRLGRSLGIDLVPFKTCSYDCIYCELGRTTCKTIERKEYICFDSLRREIDNAFSRGIDADYITLAGSGEPSLNIHIRGIIKHLKNSTTTPVAVLTNGSLLWLDEVKQDLAQADLVVPSLDANNAINFNCANRPHKSITFKQMIDGLSQFSNEYKGLLYLEVFLLGGITAMDADVKQMADIAKTIRTDKIQLNTVVRPPAEDFAYTVPLPEMKHYSHYFKACTEVIADYRSAPDEKIFNVSREDVRSLLERRPCTKEDISKGLSMHINEVVKHVNWLLQHKLIHTEKLAHKEFYCITKN